MTEAQRAALPADYNDEAAPSYNAGEIVELPGGGSFEVVKMDINKSEDLQRVAAYVKEKYGGLDGVCHNAGIAVNADQFEVLTIDEDMGTNYFATKNAIKAFYPLMRANGRICVVSSLSGNEAVLQMKEQLGDAGKALYDRFVAEDITEEHIDTLVAEYRACCVAGDREARGWPVSPYSVSKAAITAFVRYCAKEYVPEKHADVQPGVIINACCPGYCHTALTGFEGHLTTDQGAVMPLMLLTLPEGSPSGKFYTQGQVAPVDYFSMEQIMLPAEAQPHLKDWAF